MGYDTQATQPRQLSEWQPTKMNLGWDAIMNGTFVDDTTRALRALLLARESAMQKAQIGESIGFLEKCTMFSREDPHPKATKDNITCTAAGYSWHSKEDMISLGAGKMNFNRAIRGSKKPMKVDINSS